MDKLSDGTRVQFVGNFVIQTGVVTRTLKNGQICVKTDDRFNAAGRRLETGQNWVLNVASVQVTA